jgi:hypothetical protein
MKISKYQEQSVDKNTAFRYDKRKAVFYMDYINKGKDGDIILSDGKNEAVFEFIEMYVLDGTEYAVLLEEGEDFVTIMKFTEADGKNPEIYSEIEDDDVFEKVLALYNEDED